MSENADRLRLARSEGVGPITYRKLLARFGDAASALEALPHIARSAGRPRPPAIPSPDAIAREIEAVTKFGARFIFVDTPTYPPLLAELPDAPPVLMVQGDAALLSARAIALVGSRNASANGQRLAGQIAADLAAQTIVVISGLARGIDAAAHRGALTRIACVAGGLDVPYPEEHASLQSEIAASGAVISEVPLGTTPMARHFPRRNRLIAGLALGTLVVEAALKSGSLITARIALEANREVFAIPGSPLDPRGRGGNALIRAGEARLVESAQDIIDDLPLIPRLRLPNSPTANLPTLAPLDHAAATANVLALLSPEATPVDDLIRRCQFSAAEVATVLLDLELAGRIETLPGNRVALLTPP
jgi:DNA processing protein